MPQSILQYLTLPFHRDYFAVLWYQKCVLFINSVGMSGSPSAFLGPPEKLLSNLVPPDVLVPGAVQGSSSANGQAGKLTRWPRLCSSASHVSLLHHLVAGITPWGVCLSIPYTRLQLLHHWGHPLSGNSSARFETELLIFPNLTGVVRNLHVWYGFHKVAPLWLTSICCFLHLQLLLATWFPVWEEVRGSSDMLPYSYILH